VSHPSWRPGDPWDPRNPENRDRTRELRGELRELLMEWDPIGVAGVPEAADEYDSYLSGLMHLLHGGASEAQIRAHLVMILDRMGLRATGDREDRFAASLHAWWTVSTA
jgi:hypothetical protein